jgi:hypothetical protein
MKSRRLAVFLLITSLLLSASAVVFINRYNVHESHHHGTLVLKGKDNLADATKSAYVQTYIGWLENFTSKDLEVTKEGKVTVVQILNVTPRSYSLMHKLNMIIENGVTVEITLDRSPNGVFFDAFQGNGKQIQDLDDLDALPDPPAPSTTSDAWDKAQQIAHTLNEGYWAAKYAAGYIDSHRKGGISSENGARDDVGGTGDRVLDGSTWQTINATHISKHWFEPDPTDPTGKRKIEVYREIFKLKDSDGIEPQVTRIKKPANPKNVTDPTGESLIFIGRVVSIGDPCWNLWSGEIENFQPVTYEVLSVVYGNYTVGESIIVNHAIIFGHPDADPTIPRLSSTIFTYGKELRVEAVYTGYNDTVTGVPIYETDFPTSPAAPVGGIWVLVGKLELLAPYIGLALVILVATVATAIYVKRVKRGREARID